MLLRKCSSLSLIAGCFMNLCAQQTTCGFDALRGHNGPAADQEQIVNERISKRLAVDPGTEKTILTIPVVVHIIHQNGPENSTDAAVINAIGETNLRLQNAGAFNHITGHDCQIQLCLASVDPYGNPTTGITRTVSSYTNMAPGFADDLPMKNRIRWDPNLYLNIWLVNNVNVIGITGYAYYPDQAGTALDGIVCQAGAFSFAGSTLLVHELGHYLGLYHTFEGGCTHFNCAQDGDHVCDTPPDAANNWNCPDNSCATELDDTTGMSPFTADVEELPNYMDYTNCSFSFSAGQSDRMNAVLTGIRSTLLQSNGCGQNPGGAVPVASFTMDPYIPCYTYPFTNTSINSVGAQWDFNGDGLIDDCGNAINYAFPASGTYTVTMIATGYGGVDTAVQQVTVQATPNQWYPMNNGFGGVVLAPEGGGFHYCDGATVQFYGLPGMSSYLWSTGHTTQNLSFQPTQAYDITLTAVDGNGLTWTNCYPIHIAPVPKPVVSLLYDIATFCIGEEIVLHADFGYYMVSNAWYDNDGVIPGLHDTIYTIVLEDTNYIALYQHESTGCNTWSDTLLIVADSCSSMGLNDYLSDPLQLFPNPASDNIMIQWNGTPDNEDILTILQADGKQVFSRKVGAAADGIVIDLVRWDNGMYLVTLQRSDGSIRKNRFIIRK